MGVPMLQIYWLTGGFLLGMFFMYNLIPVRTHVQTRHLRARAEENSILKFGNPGKRNKRKMREIKRTDHIYRSRC